jgi:hypothetical protein
MDSLNNSQLQVTTTVSPSYIRLVITCRCLVVASKCGRSPSSGFPNCQRPQLPASHLSQPQLTIVKVNIMLRPTVSRPVYLSVKPPSGAHDQIFVTVRQLRGLLMWVALSGEGVVCSLELLLVLASAVILGFESRGTRDHILLSEIRDSPSLEGQDPVFISPSK